MLFLSVIAHVVLWFGDRSVTEGAGVLTWYNAGRHDGEELMTGFSNRFVSTSAITGVLLWIKFIHYLRAFEEFGAMVSLLFAVASDIKYFLILAEI